VKKVVFLVILILIFYLVPAQVRAGADHDGPAVSRVAVAQASKEKSSDAERKLKKRTGGKVPAGEKAPVAANSNDKRRHDKKTGGKPVRKKTPVRIAGKTVPIRPTLLSPAPATLIASWNIDFSWKGSPGKSSYRLQVSSRPTFTSVALDATTPFSLYTSVAALAPGTYYWRVRTTNAFKKSSKWSPVRRFKIPVMAPSNMTADNFINRGEESTDVAGVSLAISAASYVGVSAYYASESPDPPTATTSGWTAVTPTTSLYAATVPFTLSSGDGAKTVSVWFKDIADRLSSAATGTITLDTTPLTAMITSCPSFTSDFAPASFSFSASKAHATFECKLDSGDYSVCSSPQVYEGLAEGSHVFSVKAFKAAHMLESSPASYSWVVIRPIINTTPHGFINVKGNPYLITQKTVMLSISAVATTDKKIAGYFASENPDVPAAADLDWETFPPVKEYSGKVPFLVSDGNGAKRIYVWFKDTADNVSEAKSDTIRYVKAKYMVIILLVLQVVLLIA
jgi:hypothetical protein